MKKVLIAFAFLAVLCSCAKELTPPKFGEVSEEVSKEENGDWINLDGSAQTVKVDVTGDDWFVTSPTDDTWIIAYKNEKDGKIYVKVTKNLEDRVRESHFEVRGAGETVLRMYVRQEYDRNLAFAAPDTRIGAADGTYRIPLATNISSEEIVGAEVVAEDGEPVGWATVQPEIVYGYLLVTVEGNPSETETRSVKVSVSASGYTAEATVTQVPMTGSPYEISLADIDLDTYPVYNIISEPGDTIARVVREYLYKYDDNKKITYVNGKYDVIYPVTKPAGSDKCVVDYANGFVINNGGEVSWADNITVDTHGSEMISHYSDGGLEERPGFVYIPRGATKIRVEPLSAADAAVKVEVEAVPLVLKDERIAERGVLATDEYNVVKVGTGYWINRNYAAMSYPDGRRLDIPCHWDESKNPPLPSTKYTDADARKEYENMMATYTITPMCVVMANSSRYWNVTDSWITYRTQMGCCYTYAALVGTDINVSSKDKAANVEEVDAISPEGWTVPSPTDYQIMVNYLLQNNFYPTAKDRQHELIEKLCASDAYVPGGKNTTGFSAKGSHVGATGGYTNSAIVYMTLDYQFASKAHYVRAFRLIDSNSSPVLNMGIRAAYHVRLKMEE